MAATSLSGSFVSQILGDQRRAQTILLLDCCYSGAISSSLLAKSTLSQNDPGTLAGSGRAILMSSSAWQRSFEMESDDVGWTSAFTRAIVEGIRTGEADLDEDGLITLDELFDYTRSRLAEVSPTQTPLRSEIDVDGRVLVARAPSHHMVRGLPAELVAACESDFALVRAGAASAVVGFLLSPLEARVKAARKLLRGMSSDPDPDVARIAVEATHRRGRRPGPTATKLAERDSRVEAVATCQVEAKALRLALQKCRDVASTDEYRPILTATLLECDGSTLTLVATDSYRLYTQCLPATGDPFTALVPASSLGSMVYKAQPPTAVVTLGEHALEVEAGRSVFVHKLIAGEYPDRSKLMNVQQQVAPITFNRDDFGEALDALHSSRSDQPIVRIHKVEGGHLLSISSIADEGAPTPTLRFQGALPATFTRVAFNLNYLRDGLRLLPDDLVQARLRDDRRPALFSSDDGQRQLLLMPVRVT